MNPLKNLHCIVIESLKDLPSRLQIKDLMSKHRVEKIPIINKNQEILGNTLSELIFLSANFLSIIPILIFLIRVGNA